MEIIDGKRIAQDIASELKKEMEGLTGPPPCAAFIRVGEDPASVSYVKSKQKKAAEIGIASRLAVLPADTPQETLFQEIDALNEDPSIHGILIQAPLPKHMDQQAAFNRVHPDKDVDGFSRVNLGRLCQEDPQAFVACTPAGIIELLRRSGADPEGKHAVIAGRSLIVGKPAALLLMQKKAFANATVTVCHSRTPDLGAHTRQADILVAAIGKAHAIKGDMIKPGAVVIDVGQNHVPDPGRKSGRRLVGDVDYEQAAPIASKITPVPGGVGPMTIAMLMRNTLKAYHRQTRASKPQSLHPCPTTSPSFSS